MKKMIAAAAVAAAAILTLGTSTAFAVDEYSYLAGQNASVSRNEAYAQAQTIADEDARSAFLAGLGIGDTPWSEEAAASFSYVAGRQRGASFRTDAANDNTFADMGSYAFAAGQQRGGSYRR